VINIILSGYHSRFLLYLSNKCTTYVNRCLLTYIVHLLDKCTKTHKMHGPYCANNTACFIRFFLFWWLPHVAETKQGHHLTRLALFVPFDLLTVTTAFLRCHLRKLDVAIACVQKASQAYFGAVEIRFYR